MNREEIERRIVELFAARSEDVAAVYLFGSAARAADGPDSDVDVAVLFNGPVEPGVAGLKLGLAGDLEDQLRRPVDLVVLNTPLPPDLVHRILRDGRLLIEGNRSTRVKFEVRARNEYFDLLPVLRRYRRALRLA